MRERRQPWKIETMIAFLDISLIVATALTLASLVAILKIATSNPDTIAWRINLILLYLCFCGAVFTFLFTIIVLVHRTLGPLPRLEQVLDKVLSGDTSQRLTVRHKDSMGSFAAKVNKIIDLLDKKSRG